MHSSSRCPLCCLLTAGQIPAIKDGDLSFYESRAITRYVNETRGGKLTPATVGERALMEQWISLEQGTINPDVSVIVYQRVFAPMYGGKPDEAVVKLHAEKIVKALDIMSAHLEKNQYLAGASFSLADLFYMPYFQLLTVTPEANLISSRPALAAWWKRISERASWQKVLSLSEFAQKK